VVDAAAVTDPALDAAPFDLPGARTARAHGGVAAPDPRRRRPAADVAPRGAAANAAIERAVRALAADPDARASRSAVAEWLLDNGHVLREARELLRHDLPPAFTRVLPRLAESADGRRRADAIATAVVAESDAPVDGPALERFVDAYQRVEVLTTGELWALPAFLRLALLEDLARVAVRHVPAAAPAGRPGDARPEADDERRARRAVLALRELAGLDWRAFVERASHVEEVLRGDPGGSHREADFETRDRARRAVEAIARGSGRDEVAVAALAVDACLAPAPADAKRRHVAWHLLGAGRPALEARAGYRTPARDLPARWMLAHPAVAYFGGLALVTAGLLAAVAAFLAGRVDPAWGAVTLGLASLLAVSVATALVNVVVTTVVPPRRLPRLDLDAGIPDSARTLVVVPLLLGRPDETRGVLESLERDFVGNEDRNVAFALLTDLPDADTATDPADAEVLRAAVDGVTELNVRHAQAGVGPFLLLHRDRRLDARSGRHRGWERKRGKLQELLRALLDGDLSAFPVRVGALERLAGVRYLLTRDADSCLPPTSVAQLVATMAHPLNRAVVDAEGRVTDGHAVLQPRLEPSPAGARRTPFTRVFAGDRGLDPYATIVSDVFHDLFGEGSFAGKGLLDVAAFHRALDGKVPENTLLSHDLFEGLHARAGLVSDVVLLEDVPADVPAHAARAHRWVRGDWQLLPWLAPRVPVAGGARVRNPFGVVARWRIVDNLLRSLVAPALVALAVVGWLAVRDAALATTLVVLATLAAPLGSSLLSTVFRCGNGAPWGLALANELASARLALGRWAATVLLLPFEAYVAADAIVRTLWRLAVTRQRLLEWTPAAHADRVLRRARGLGATVRRMLAAPAFALLTAAAVVTTAPGSLAAALPLLVAWLVSPLVAHRLGLRRSARPETVGAARRQELRVLARRTWLYFERFVGPNDHWLPPDNFQEEPGGRVARRTSPTNVGLALLSTLGAHDLGYVGLLGLEARLRSTFDTLDRLERHRGHLFNWYETQHLAPLEPRYVSTVDSGNLVGCLWALASGCEDVVHARVVRPAQRAGLLDTIDVLGETLGRARSFGPDDASRDAQAALAALRARLDAPLPPRGFARLVREVQTGDLPRVEEQLARLAEQSADRADPGALADLRLWAARLRERVTYVHRELATLAPWLTLGRDLASAATTPADAVVVARVEAVLDAMPEAPPLDEVPTACDEAARRVAGVRDDLGADPATGPEAAQACDTVTAALAHCATEARALVERLRRLVADARRSADATDFAFLYDARRRLLHLGYDASAGRLDPNHYDLLASESRLASFVGIAKGDLPARHWLHLGRPLARLPGGACLRSWSGTMFEYLMPGLLLRAPARTLLGESCDTAVAEQIAAGRRGGRPWGTSESGFAELDADGAYGYWAFGARSLALRRDTAVRDVVAPYASALALTRRPAAVLANLDRLRALGMVGRYGLYEALDYGPTGEGRTPTPVRSYMAHHEAMILVALCNLLLDDVFVARLGADARVRAFDLLLDERLPVATTREPAAPEAAVPTPSAPPPSAVTSAVATDGLPPRTTVLSNGRLSSWLTAAGGGGLRWRDVALTRWRTDGWEDAGGTWVYLRDEPAGAAWSVGDRPVPAAPGTATARFGPHVVELQRREHGILARVDIAVAPWDDVEVRRITLVNEGEHPRSIRVTTATEVLLAAVGEARRHPAFSRLFVESELLPALGGIHVRRRARSPDDEPVHLVQCLVGGGADAAPRSFETDRGRFLGRHGTDRTPAAVGVGALAGRAGATLDPIVAISTLVRVGAGARVTLTLLTSVAGSRERAIELVEAHRGAGAAEAVFEQARRERERAMRDLGIAPADARVAHDLLSACLAPGHAVRGDAGPFDDAARPRSELWGHRISGDLPIVLLRLAPASDLGVAFEALRLHAYLQDRGAALDLVFVDEEPSGYASARRDRLEAERARLRAVGTAVGRGGSFVIPRDRLDAPAVRLLEAWAVVVLDDRRSVATQLERLDEATARLPAFVAVPGAETTDVGTGVERPSGLRHDNGYGGFDAAGPGYVVYARPGRPTPAPWGNVLANPDFGAFVTEAGSGWTWRTNSAEHRLTPWRNDPVRDDPGEVLYLRDEESGAVWTPTPLPVGGGAPVVVRHTPAATTFERRSHGLRQEMRVAVACDAPVKIVTLRLENLTDRPRRLTATYYAEWVLGTTREATAAHLLTAYEDDALLARNPTAAPFGARVAFLASDTPATGMTCDRVEFLGRGGVRDPAGLRRIGLSGAVGGRLDPCGALQVGVDVPAGATREVRFLLGEGTDAADVRALLARLRPAGAAAAAATDAAAAWDRLLGAVKVTTPDPDVDLLMNGRLLHQVVACRMWGRSGLYQPGGAFGFRDQLQDAMALVCAAPALARAHLLEAARRQFPEGDVLHWWHVETDAGVRTRCSDDRLWLPFAVAHYVRWTGDRDVLDVEVPFLVGEPLAPGERERYARFAPDGPGGSLAEHCLRALERDPGAGAHGLPLMGTGDWNDGMNRVGAGGRGESVWLAWFLYAAWTRFAPLCVRGDHVARAEALRRRAEALRATVERTAWDGRWYLRAFYDDGTPLGGAASDEGRIDLVSQAWAVLSGAANRSRATRAMASAADHLAEPDLHLVRLLAPPFDRTPLEPGYVKGYPPGVRENGAQYTHAAIWGAWAFAVLGEGDTALEWFRMASPVTHASTRADADRYRVEPYVVAGDISVGDGYDGRGGWTWYTGSAAWLYRLGLERILGIRRVGTTLVVDPCVPAAWPRFEVVLRTGRTVHRIRVENPDGVSRGVATATLDGRPVSSAAIPFVDDGETHGIAVVLGAPESAV